MAACKSAYLLIALLWIPCFECARFLIIPMQFPSRNAGLLFVGNELVRRDHEVYCLVAEGRKHKVDTGNVTMVTYSHPADIMVLPSDEFDQYFGAAVFSNKQQSQADYEEYGREFEDCMHMIQDLEMMERVSALRIDVAIVDGMYLPPCYMAVAERLNLRFISMTTCLQPWWMGVPEFPVFTNAAPLIDSRDIMDRVGGSVLWLVKALAIHTPSLTDHWMGIDSNRLLRHLPNIHNWADLYSKADLYIVTSDHHLGWPAPAFPNIKYLPGISLQPVQPLGGDMNELLEKNPSGVILASFGSLSVHLPNEIILNFIDAFQRLSQTVIWKIRHLKAEHRELLSPNIHVFNWLAQNDILGHRNVRMFITHCGNNGQHESIYHAVPMIGFPMYFDQFENAARLQQKGIGIEMNMRNFSSDHLVDNILTILKYNSTYKQNAKKISSILRSRPMLPKEEAAYWIEHVAQFGSGHLRPVTTAMSPFEMYGLDVACAGLVSLLVTIIALVCGSLRVIVFITQMRELK